MGKVRFERLFDKRRYGVLTQDIAAEWDTDMSGYYYPAADYEALETKLAALESELAIAKAGIEAMTGRIK